MVWFFARDGQSVRVETRIDSQSGEYVVDVTQPDGATETERFADREAFRVRLKTIEQQLQADAWQQVSAAVLPPAWRGPFTN